jgi:HEAT repeat protein
MRVKLGPDGIATPEAGATVDRDEWTVRTEDRRAGSRPCLLRGEDAVSALVADLADPSPAARIAAADLLGRLCGGQRAARAAADRLALETRPEVRVALLGTLHHLGVRGAVPEVEAALKDAAAAVRERALRCWLDLAGRDGLDAVGRMIDDPEPGLRRLALVGLRTLADPRGRDWARKALADDDPSVVKEAERMLSEVPDQE